MIWKYMLTGFKAVLIHLITGTIMSIVLVPYIFFSSAIINLGESLMPSGIILGYFLFLFLGLMLLSIYALIWGFFADKMWDW